MRKIVCLFFILLSCYSTVTYAGIIIPYPIDFDYSSHSNRTSNEQHTLFLARKLYKQLLSGVVIYNASKWARKHQSKHQLVEVEKPFPKDNADIARFHRNIARGKYGKYSRKLKKRKYEIVLWIELEDNWQDVINNCAFECQVPGKMRYLDRHYKHGSLKFTLTYRQSSHYFTGESLKKFDHIVSDLLIKQEKNK
ncbi:MAG: hypothetical protein KAH77_02895 [Thiomargarita sp.]|nr:hypothetical protein [Thiomargarita sp.]